MKEINFVHAIINSLTMQPQAHDSSDSQELEQPISQSQEEQVYITDPQEFLDFSVQDKKIKVMDECNAIWSHVYLKDISLHKKGPLQDKIYSRVGKYYRNIRRGNTLCQVYHEDQNSHQKQQYDLFFCRRGMKKFYDLEPEYLLHGANLPTNHRLMKNRIFERLESELEQPNAKYHLYRLFKENGEHCQIGYVRQLECWLFASKNVAILARTPKDLEENYHKERFYWAKLVGEEFFRILEGFSAGQQQAFKQDIDGFTLLGEHCGHDKHQHITRYDKVEIIFYGLVKNTGSDHCQSVEQCRTFLAKYGLKMSACHERKNLTDKNTIYASMYEMLKEVAEGTMEREGEGSVMYIVCEREGVQRTVGMCKLKTCEYLIYRRLREMLKLNVSRKGSTANNFDKFKYDIEQLVSHYFKPPKNLQFYFKLGDKAFHEIGNNAEISETYLRYKFVDFIGQVEQAEKQKQLQTKDIEVVPCKPKRILLICLPRTSNSLQKFCKSKEIQLDYMYRAGKSPSKNTIHILYMIPRLPAKLQEDTQLLICEYDQKGVEECVQQLGECKDISKSHLITFIKSADKGKSVRMLNDKIDAFREVCKKQQIPFRNIPLPTEEAIIEEIKASFETEAHSLQSNGKQQKVRRYVVLPMLIPGSGKSSLAQELKKSEREWRFIDTDKIRRDIMQAEDQVDLNSEKSQELFIKSKVEATEQYKQHLLAQITSPSSVESYLYVDRLFSPYNIQETIDFLLSAKQPALQIVILTQSYFPVRVGEFIYPFSWNYLFTCLRRCLERESHQTMANNPYDVAKIVLKYYQMSANFNEKTVIKLNQERVRFVQLPFVQDGQGSHYIHQNLKKKLQECLRLIEPGRHAKDSNDFIQLIEQIYKFTEIKEENSMKKYHQFRLELERQLKEE